MQYIKKLLFIVMIFLSSSSAFANDANQQQVQATQSEIEQIIKAEKNDGDDFHKILESMWGGFIFGDANGDPTLLSHVVGYTNVLALVLGIIIVTYVSVASVINSAQSGEVLGRQWNSYWLPIRTAMAFGLLVPTQAGAFALSTAQVIVIKLIIMASTSATFLWNKAVDESLGLTPAQPTVVLPYKLAYETSLTTACALTAARELNMGDPEVVTFRFTDGTSMGISESDSEMRHNASAFKGRMREIKQSINNSKFVESVTFWEGDCGNISFNIPSFESEDYNAFTLKDDNTSAKESFQASVDIARIQLLSYQHAYMDYISNFAEHVFGKYDYTYRSMREMRTMQQNNDATNFTYGSVAESYYNELEDEERPFSLVDSSREPSRRASTADKILARMTNYKMVIDTFIETVEGLYEQNNELFRDNYSLSAQQIKEEITKGGWVYAGSFFYKISQIEGKSHETSSSMISGSSAAGVIKCTGCSDGKRQIASSEMLSLMYKHLYIIPLQGIDPPEHPEAMAVPLVSSATINDGINESIVSDTISSWAVKTLAGLGEHGITDSNLAGSDLNSVSSDNPFQFAANIGHGMNNIRYILMISKLAISSAIFTVEFGMDAANASFVGFTGVNVLASAAVGILKATAMMVLEIITIALTLLTAMSWILAYYIPMMPALLWITLIGAYLLIVIEAVVATPLAVVLMATPEGEGISGSKMQNAITLLASVFLRPSLMIIGLIAAIYVAKYSFMILNAIFWSQAESAVSGDLFAFFATFSLYITALHQVLSNSIKSMDSLPTAILNWIGQGANAQFGQNEISAAGDQLSQKEGSFGKAGDSFKSVFDQKMNASRHSDIKSAIEKNKGNA